MKKSKKKEQKSADEIRETILRFFYDRHKNASSPKRVRLKISDAKSALKELGISGKEAVSNIEYLIDGGWLIKEVEEKEYTTPKGVKIPQKTPQYKASNKTIDHFDKGESIFKKNEASGINITNIQGVTTLTVGNNNDIIVNSEMKGLWSKLDELNNSIKHSNLSDKEKLDYSSDIETIQSQIQKPQPDKTIIKKAWNNLKKVAGVAGTLATLYSKIEPLIKIIL
jgi:hypothetical protein